MFAWLTRRFGAAAIIADTRRTLSAVLQMPQQTQAQIANEIALTMSDAEATLRRLPSPPNPQVDEAIRELLRSAAGRRHAALLAGAQNHDDPQWACAALQESWVIAVSGKLGRAAFNSVDGELRAFIDHAAVVGEPD